MKIKTAFANQTSLGFWTRCHLLPGIIVCNAMPQYPFYHFELRWLQFVFSLWLTK